MPGLWVILCRREAPFLQEGDERRPERLLEGGRNHSYQDLAGLLRLWKQSEEYGFLREAHSQALQQTLKDLDRAWWDGLKKAKGMPRFRKKGRQDSCRYPQGFKINGSRIYLPKIGWVGCRQSRDILGEPKNTMVFRHGCYWIVSTQTERKVFDLVPTFLSAAEIGIGASCFVTFSDGTVCEPLNSCRRLENKLAREQRQLFRKQKFSGNWRKQKDKIARRQGYSHKISTEISKNHALIVMEDLRVQKLSVSAKGTRDKLCSRVCQEAGLHKAILDRRWYELRW